ncbi:hypothetical protein HZC09_01960 [Candidatus Micrarchaeota archaeon]|nr:hypothetical protein [Candidatus Micrarchaeota archaeon]
MDAYLKGALAGIAAAIVSAVIWAFVTVSTGYQLGIIAALVGGVVGFAVYAASGKATSSTRMIAALMAAVGIFFGIYLTVVASVVQYVTKAGAFDALLISLTSFQPAFFEIAASTLGPFDFLFAAIGVYFAYKYSVPADEPSLPQERFEPLEPAGEKKMKKK